MPVQAILLLFTVAECILNSESRNSKQTVPRLSAIDEAFLFMKARGFSFQYLQRYFNEEDLLTFIEHNATYTFLLPTDNAFSKIMPNNIEDPFLTNKRLQMRLLRNIIAQGKINLNKLESGQQITTMEGNRLTITMKNGRKYLNYGNKAVVKVENENVHYCQVPRAKLYAVERVPVITADEVEAARDACYRKGWHPLDDKCQAFNFCLQECYSEIDKNCFGDCYSSRQESCLRHCYYALNEQ